jgi:phosphoribosylanthranilate isomerase
MKVKICGITNVEDAVMCEDLGVDAIGLVHFNGRFRSRGLDEISQICSSLGPSILKVLVCCPKDANSALEMLRKSGADALQLYSLGAYEMDQLRDQGVKVFRVVKPDEPRAAIFSEGVDALVFEGGCPGTGESYDYSSIPAALRRCAFIAGGLTPENVHIAKALDPYGVDVSSGVENALGSKDRGKVEEFIRRCKP